MVLSGGEHGGVGGEKILDFKSSEFFSQAVEDYNSIAERMVGREEELLARVAEVREKTEERVGMWVSRVVVCGIVMI